MKRESNSAEDAGSSSLCFDRIAADASTPFYFVIGDAVGEGDIIGFVEVPDVVSDVVVSVVVPIVSEPVVVPLVSVVPLVVESIVEPDVVPEVVPAAVPDVVSVASVVRSPPRVHPAAATSAEIAIRVLNVFVMMILLIS